MINLYKQNEGFDSSTFSGKVINGVEQIPDEIKDKLIQVEDQVYQDLKDHKLMWKDGELVDNPDYESYNEELNKSKLIHEKQSRVNELKQLLAESDYRAIKYFEGYYTDEQYEPYKVQRQAYRDEINQLETEINNIENIKEE